VDGEVSTRRLRLLVEYVGTGFSGWQRQENAVSVQGTIERALATLEGRPVTIRGAGRTDAGVHAEGQVAHFDTTSRIPLHGYRRGLNTHLPRSIAIAEVAEVPPDFDARFSATGKLYRYQLWTADSRSARLDPFVWHERRAVDAERMHQAAQRLVGRHDFAAFRAADCERRTTVRTVTRLSVERHGALVTVEIEADAFLKNMVRIIVGTLAEIGRGTREENSLEELLQAGDRTQAGVTAPAQGLTLVRVDYAPGGRRAPSSLARLLDGG
jgi:tRNA pseudouridine38-40 synthase